LSDPRAGYPEHLKEQVNGYLGDLSFSNRDQTAGLEAAMRYSLLAGGKRIRPVLCLATARALGIDPASVMPTAAALELIHTYSLIHDDLPAMDDDDLRRGRPTAHVAYGEDVAILAGDALFAEAVRLVCKEQAGEPSRVLAVVSEIAAATGVDGMVGGQYFDVTGTAEASPDSLRLLHSLKTGRLITASVCAAVVLAGAPEPQERAFRQFASELGILFQIVDDILDVTGDDQSLGKPHGSDERHGKQTFVSVFGVDEARRLSVKSRDHALEALRRLSGETIELDRITEYVFARQT